MYQADNFDCKKKVKGAGFGLRSGWLVVDGAVAPRYHAQFCSLPIRVGSGTVRDSCGLLHQLFSSQDTDDVERVKISRIDNDRLWNG